MVNSEIDIQLCKEQIETLQSQLKNNEHDTKSTLDNFENSKSLLDKNYFNAIKLIEENHSRKEKEIEDKFNVLTKNLNRELRDKNSFIKKIASENKSKYRGRGLSEDDIEYLTISQVEDHFTNFENRIRNCLTEINNKDKYISIVEQKYELINEENKFIKKKVKEEKEAIYEKINQIQKEDRNDYEQRMSKINGEISSTKISFQSKIDKSLESSEIIIKNINIEKDDLKEKNMMLNNHLLSAKNENKELWDEINKKQSEIRNMKNKLETCFIEKQEFENLKKTYEEVKKHLIEEKSKILNLKLENRILEEKLDIKFSRKIIDDYEKKKQSYIDKFIDDNNSDVYKKQRDTILTMDSDKLKYIAMIKLKDEELESNNQFYKFYINLINRI